MKSRNMFYFFGYTSINRANIPKYSKVGGQSNIILVMGGLHE